MLETCAIDSTVSVGSGATGLLWGVCYTGWFLRFHSHVTFPVCSLWLVLAAQDVMPQLQLQQPPLLLAATLPHPTKEIQQGSIKIYAIH